MQQKYQNKKKIFQSLINKLLPFLKISNGYSSKYLNVNFHFFEPSFSKFYSTLQLLFPTRILLHFPLKFFPVCKYKIKKNQIKNKEKKKNKIFFQNIFIIKKKFQKKNHITYMYVQYSIISITSSRSFILDFSTYFNEMF